MQSKLQGIMKQWFLELACLFLGLEALMVREEVGSENGVGSSVRLSRKAVVLGGGCMAYPQSNSNSNSSSSSSSRSQRDQEDSC
mmetsp:Transcript_20729/g.54038  ORF Transcript_20729/g.54038 Transcript_20729/m.54038 type:complete len:84 (+) Transcript_20729:2483-2734(+)